MVADDPYERTRATTNSSLTDTLGFMLSRNDWPAFNAWVAGYWAFRLPWARKAEDGPKTRIGSLLAPSSVARFLDDHEETAPPSGLQDLQALLNQAERLLEAFEAKNGHRLSGYPTRQQLLTASDRITRTLLRHGDALNANEIAGLGSQVISRNDPDVTDDFLVLAERRLSKYPELTTKLTYWWVALADRADSPIERVVYLQQAVHSVRAAFGDIGYSENLGPYKNVALRSTSGQDERGTPARLLIERLWKAGNEEFTQLRPAAVALATLAMPADPSIGRMLMKSGGLSTDDRRMLAMVGLVSIVGSTLGSTWNDPTHDALAGIAQALDGKRSYGNDGSLSGAIDRAWSQCTQAARIGRRNNDAGMNYLAADYIGALYNDPRLGALPYNLEEVVDALMRHDSKLASNVGTVAVGAQCRSGNVDGAIRTALTMNELAQSAYDQILLMPGDSRALTDELLKFPNEERMLNFLSALKNPNGEASDEYDFSYRYVRPNSPLNANDTDECFRLC